MKKSSRETEWKRRPKRTVGVDLAAEELSARIPVFPQPVKTYSVGTACRIVPSQRPSPIRRNPSRSQNPRRITSSPS
jgi:hypothetical protein